MPVALVGGALLRMYRRSSVVERLGQAASTEADHALHRELRRIYDGMSYLGDGWNERQTAGLCAAARGAERSALSADFNAAVEEVVRHFRCAPARYV